MGDTSWKDVKTWHDFADANSEFAHVNLKQIQHVASVARNGIQCEITRYTHGMYNAVFEVGFEDKVAWICRVHKADANVSPASVQAKIESTVATMRYIKCQLPSFPIPKVFAFEGDSTTSPVGSGYILMEGMKGVEVGGSCGLSSVDEKAVYTQLAYVEYQLSNLCFPKIGRIYQSETGEFEVGPFVDRHGQKYGPFATSVDFFNYEAHKISESHSEWRSRSKEDGSLSMTACELYMKAASSLSDYDTGSFPLAHNDFDTHNALFERDSEGNLQLTAILDWDGAHSVTWLQFCFFPTFLKIRWPSFERGKYSPLVLRNIQRRQHIFLDALQQNEHDMMETNVSRPRNLYQIYNSPAVRVAEFILIFSDPYYECSGDLIEKYLEAWKIDQKHRVERD